MKYQLFSDIESCSISKDSTSISKPKLRSLEFLKRKRAIKRRIVFSVYLSLACLLLFIALPLRWVVLTSDDFLPSFELSGVGIAAEDLTLSRSLRAATTDDNAYTVQNVSNPLAASNTSQDSSSAQPGDKDEDCIPRAVDEFPSGPFSVEDRRNGAFVVHIFVALYMFVALAIVCDDFFVPSLEILCEKLQMSEDVAGATFMSAGSSAPEFFTSLIGVFVAQNDVGVGTIVGSAVFNILCIIGICALFGGRAIQLTWWPLCRDSFYYLIAVIALIAVAYDSVIHWFESVILVVLYVFYILLMTFNRYIQDAINQKFKASSSSSSVMSAKKESEVRGIAVQTTEYPGPKARYTVPQQYVISPNDKEIFQPRDFADASLRVMLSSNFKPACRMRAAARIIIAARKRESQILLLTDATIDKLAATGGAQTHVNNYQIHVEKRHNCEDEITKDVSNEQNGASNEHGDGSSSSEAGGGSGSEGLCSIPSGCLGFLKWISLLPINLAFFITVPDCREEKWKSWFFVSFVNSILWISVLSYLMVWMTTVIGDALSIPDTVMGVTFLAGGTSIPDCMASLLVARQGLGDMAVSNSIGSNVFDILVGLGIPWFLKTVIISWNYDIRIRSKGLKWSVVLLFISVAITIVSIGANKWRLNRKLGILFLATYVVYIAIACLIELNVFVNINPPTCN